ncbi:unnamed protein product [Polarella glacialis]|uniref:Uncharacterized protein n=1 Tax=Polarella glacialis TaxID=89957 RepID=A0A813GV23_POLGL|nr:unnamed protein product [Polarella glacialis]CAE8643350.1 unnamed protein product [Polarella glacialis]CAE8643351.1 unnamed protein product [Polarella glacialis]CAE8648088.1 unnamed protein product [Polarella glacialis]CAE8698920.1 unnamed protein product [Polarella glacialis]
MGRSSNLVRIAVLAVAALAMQQLAFVAAPSSAVSSNLRSQGAAVAVAAGMLAAVPVPALAAEQTFDGWGPPEIIAVLVPMFLVGGAYGDWESRQDSVDDVTGYGTLGKQVDGNTKDKPAYFRRSEETG